jgi:hypothetical protein
MHVRKVKDPQLDANGYTSLLGASISMSVSQVDSVTIAMEFVLKLESPCLPHLQAQSDHNSSVVSSPTSKASPHGHVHMASAALLYGSPNPSPLEVSAFSPAPSTASNSSCWSTSRATLERLLEIADDLPLDMTTEMTPVQAWNCITKVPTFGNLRIDALSALADLLLTRIKCFG